MVSGLELELIIIVMGIVALAFWKKHPYLYLMAAIVCVFFGLELYDTFNTPLGLCLAFVIGAGYPAFAGYKIIMKLLGKEE